MLDLKDALLYFWDPKAWCFFFRDTQPTISTSSTPEFIHRRSVLLTTISIQHHISSQAEVHLEKCRYLQTSLCRTYFQRQLGLCQVIWDNNASLGGSTVCNLSPEGSLNAHSTESATKTHYTADLKKNLCIHRKMSRSPLRNWVLQLCH